MPLLLLSLTACGVTESSLIGTWTINSFVQRTTDVFDGDFNLEPSVTEGEDVPVDITGTLTFDKDEAGTVSATDVGGTGDYPIIMWVLSETNLPDDFQTYYADICGRDWPSPLSAPQLIIATEYLAFNQTWYASGSGSLTLVYSAVTDYSPTQRSCQLSTLELSR